MIRLAHITIASGHLTMVARRDVADAGIAAAGQLIDQAITAGVAQLPAPRAGYGISVEIFGGALLVSVVGLDKDHTSFEPIAIFGVAARGRQGRRLWQRLLEVQGMTAAVPAEPPAPWCGVAILPALWRHDGALEWLGQLEQEIAMAWLERGR